MKIEECKSEHYYYISLPGAKTAYVYPDRQTVEFFAYPDNIVLTETQLKELLALLKNSFNGDKTSSSTKQNQSKE